MAHDDVSELERFRQRREDAQDMAMIDAELADNAALARCLVAQNVDIEQAPQLLCAMAGYLLGRAVVLGLMTEHEALAAADPWLASEINGAIEHELLAHDLGARSWAQWPGG